MSCSAPPTATAPVPTKPAAPLVGMGRPPVADAFARPDDAALEPPEGAPADSGGSATPKSRQEAAQSPPPVSNSAMRTAFIEHTSRQREGRFLTADHEAAGQGVGREVVVSVEVQREEPADGLVRFDLF
jgi:hypothetical protein